MRWRWKPARAAPATLVINKLPQFIRQVTGDMRQSRPGIKVVPVDSGADVKTAEVRAGMIRYVENRSRPSTSTRPAPTARSLAESAIGP
jgi:hypothetical protein